MRLTEEERIRRKTEIIHCAFQHFSRTGIQQVTMKEIAAAAGVGKASVFRYFVSKTELLIETQKLLWQEIYEEISPVTRTKDYGQKNGMERLEAFLDAMEALYQEHSDYLLFAAKFRIYMIRQNLRMESAIYNEMLSPVCNIFFDILSKGLADGSIAVQGNPWDIFFTVWEIFRGYIDSMIINEHMLTGKSQMRSRVRFVRAMIIKTLSGNEEIEVFR